MINAVILLNDDLDTVSASHAGGGSNLFFLLSVSIPRPLFPSKIHYNNQAQSRGTR